MMQLILGELINNNDTFAAIIAIAMIVILLGFSITMLLVRHFYQKKHLMQICDLYNCKSLLCRGHLVLG